MDFSNLSIKFRDTSINYGLFLQSVLDFLIVSFCIFIFIKAFNKLFKKEKKEEVKETKSKELETLEEIRDILKKGNK